MVWRSRVIFTRSSREASSAGEGARTCTAAAGCGTGVGCAAARSIAASMSPLVTRPSRPLPGTAAASMPLSAASLRTDGASGTSAGATLAGCAGAACGGGGTSGARGRGCSGPAPTGLAVAVFSLGFAVGLAAAPAPSSMRPSRAPTATVEPSLAAMSDRTPAAGAGTSMVTLSVSSSTTGSSAATASPGCLNQRPIVASVTDSPRVGTRISAMILFPFAGSGQERRDRRGRPGGHDERSIQCVVEQGLQLGKVLGHEAGGGRCRSGPAGIARTLVLGADLIEHPLDERIDEEPCAHVARLFLAPHDLGLFEARQLVHQRLGGKRVELLDPHEIDVVDAALLALLIEVVIDLAGAQHDTADLVVGHQLRVIPQHPMEGGAAAQLVEPRYRPLVAQQALRRHQDQRLADLPFELPAQ